MRWIVGSLLLIRNASWTACNSLFQQKGLVFMSGFVYDTLRLNSNETFGGENL